MWIVLHTFALAVSQEISGSSIKRTILHKQKHIDQEKPKQTRVINATQFVALKCNSRASLIGHSGLYIRLMTTDSSVHTYLLFSGRSHSYVMKKNQTNVPYLNTYIFFICFFCLSFILHAIEWQSEQALCDCPASVPSSPKCFDSRPSEHRPADVKHLMPCCSNLNLLSVGAYSYPVDLLVFA